MVRLRKAKLTSSLVSFLKTVASESLPSLLNAIIVLTRLGSIVLTSHSEIFRAAIGLAKTHFENTAAALALVELCVLYLDENSAAAMETMASICYQMSDFGFKSLFFGFQERCRPRTGMDPLIGVTKMLLRRLITLQDPLVFIRQMFAFVVPVQPPPAQPPAPEASRTRLTRLMDENLLHCFFSDFSKPTFEPLPAQTLPLGENSNLNPLNILEALESGRPTDAVKRNTIDLMDLCQALVKHGEHCCVWR